MYKENVFTKIINKELPARVEMESDEFLCFHDINPDADLHLLVIPKGLYTNIEHLMQANPSLLRGFFDFAMEVIKAHNLTHYKLVMNAGDGVGHVPHLHMHILSWNNNEIARAG